MNQRLGTAVGIAFILSATLACSLLRPKTPLTWHILLEVEGAAPEKASTVKRVMSTIERRLDAVGLAEATVVAEDNPPSGQILVSLPQVRDRERVLKLITSQGLLELTAVVSPPNSMPAQTYSTEEEARASIEESAAGTRRVVPLQERSGLPTGDSDQQMRRWVVVEAPPIVDGRDVRDASAIYLGEHSGYQISFSLGPEGAEKFGAWTSAHINHYIGVVLNGEVKSIAFIQSRISDQAQINGRFTKQAAEDLALILRAGSLPAPVKLIRESNN